MIRERIGMTQREAYIVDSVGLRARRRALQLFSDRPKALPPGLPFKWRRRTSINPGELHGSRSSSTISAGMDFLHYIITQMYSISPTRKRFRPLFLCCRYSGSQKANVLVSPGVLAPGPFTGCFFQSLSLWSWDQRKA